MNDRHQSWALGSCSVWTYANFTSSTSMRTFLGSQGGTTASDFQSSLLLFAVLTIILIASDQERGKKRGWVPELCTWARSIDIGRVIRIEVVKKTCCSSAYIARLVTKRAIDWGRGQTDRGQKVSHTQSRELYVMESKTLTMEGYEVGGAFLTSITKERICEQNPWSRPSNSHLTYLSIFQLQIWSKNEDFCDTRSYDSYRSD